MVWPTLGSRTAKEQEQELLRGGRGKRRERERGTRRKGKKRGTEGEGRKRPPNILT